MKWLYKKTILVLTIVLVVNGFFWSFIEVANGSSQNVHVQVNVPDQNIGCGSNCPSPDSPPVISSVIITVSSTSATVSWSATDDKGVASVGFEYGLDESYGQSALVVGNHLSNLTGLASNTKYFFRIIATDTAGQHTYYTSSLQTNSQPFLPDLVPPVISNINVTSSINSAVITFNTDEKATSQINYGLTVGLGSSASEGGPAVFSHSVNLVGLSAGKKYFFQIIATDESGNAAQAAILNFTTAPDITAPPQILNLQIQVTPTSFILSWQNPSLLFVPDFAGVKVLRKIGSAVTGPNDSSGVVVYNSTGETFTDNAVIAGQTYFYTVFSYDNSSNYSDGDSVSGKINIVVTPEICNNGIDDDGNGQADCFDAACVSDPSCKIVIVSSSTSTDHGGEYACSDGKDNDGDGLVDFPSDPGCTSGLDNDEYNSPTITVSDFQKVSLDKVRFYSGARQIEIFPKQKTIFGLAGSNLSLSVRKSDLASLPVSFILHVGETDRHQFVLDSSGNTYYVDTLFPATGKSQAFLEIDYGAGQFDSLGVDLQAVNFGKVTDSDGKKMSGAQISLYKDNGELFSAETFGQKNPQISDSLGNFGWMVPNGNYYLSAEKEKYYSFQSGIFSVKDNIINQPISLVAVPPKLLDDVNPNDSVVVSAGKIAGNFAKKAKAGGVLVAQGLQKAAGVITAVTSDPTVKQVANRVVAPTAVGVAAVGTLAFLSWTEILPLLRFLFLQPLLLIGRGKREKWGTVYNSLSKLPIDLATVRLINVETGRLTQTKVTGSDGRYFFVVNAGKYRLEVKKGNLIFPTVLLKDIQIDGQKLDVYHGEEIQVTTLGAVITANIPLDPIGEKIATPRRLIWNKILRRLQSVIGWIGLVVTLVSLYISPVWYMWPLLVAHLFFTFIFKRLSKPMIAKGWGIVYDEGGKKPLSKVVARLFDSKFNKLVATEVTDNNGRYYFMAGDNQYYISFDHEGYESLKTEEIDLRGKAAETIAQDVKLKKK